jgi:pyrroloquinoline quinone (PQQ) biosynthesis protein C
MGLTRADALKYYDVWPFERHPLWVAILDQRLTKEQVILAEIQHYLRSNVGRLYRERAAIGARLIGGELFELLDQTAREECQYDDSGPSHVDLIRSFLLANGVTQRELDRAVPTPANAAAMALYKDIADRGPLQHMIGAGCVEYFYSKLSPRIFSAYVDGYGFSADAARTYELHGPMDAEHGERALKVLETPLAQAMPDEINVAVRDAFAATSLHYDGMLQAAIPTSGYWSGR